MADPGALARASAADLGRRLAAGSVDARDLAELFLERIAAYPDKTVFFALTPERARAEARAAAERHRAGLGRGPLDGVPVVWKDLVDVAGTVTTAGSDLLRHNPPAGADAEVVAQAAGAGMVSLGKTHLPEFAFSGLGQNPHFGTPRNPRDSRVSRLPGGSSSGSAVAIAAGLAPCALGTDTGGSIRIPASFTGVVGFKTSEGRIGKRGLVPLSHTLDTVGPMGRTVEDCILLDAAFRGVPVPRARRAEVGALSILAPAEGNVAFEGAEDEVRANFEEALGRLGRAGARIVRRPLDLFADISRLTAAHGSIISAEAYFHHKGRIDGPEGARMDPRVITRIRRGKEMSAYDLLVVIEERKRLIATFAREMEGHDALAIPTTPITAPETAPTLADDETFFDVYMRAIQNTTIGNFLGVCALALPCGEGANGMPTSIMFMAPGAADDALLGCGLAIEGALGAT